MCALELGGEKQKHENARTQFNLAYKRKTRGKVDLPRVSCATPEPKPDVALPRVQPGESMIG